MVQFLLTLLALHLSLEQEKRQHSWVLLLCRAFLNEESRGDLQTQQGEAAGQLLCGQSELKAGALSILLFRGPRDRLLKGSQCTSSSQPSMFLVRQGNTPEHGRSKTFTGSQAHGSE